MKKLFTIFITVFLISLFASCDGKNSYYESPKSSGGERYGEAIYGKSRFK